MQLVQVVLELVVLGQEGIPGSSQVQHMSALVVQSKDYSKNELFHCISNLLE